MYLIVTYYTSSEAYFIYFFNYDFMVFQMPPFCFFLLFCTRCFSCSCFLSIYCGPNSLLYHVSVFTIVNVLTYMDYWQLLFFWDFPNRLIHLPLLYSIFVLSFLFYSYSTYSLIFVLFPLFSTWNISRLCSSRLVPLELINVWYKFFVFLFAASFVVVRAVIYSLFFVFFFFLFSDSIVEYLSSF